MNAGDKPLVWLEGKIKTPPFSKTARIEAGTLLRRLQRGDKLGMPQSRSMPSIGARCHELRIRDAQNNWRIIYRTDKDAIISRGNIFEEIWSDTAKSHRIMPSPLEGLRFHLVS
jgi:hypothetical protein